MILLSGEMFKLIPPKRFVIFTNSPSGSIIIACVSASDVSRASFIFKSKLFPEPEIPVTPML
ncbi:hypothetical protein Btm27_05234 [Bacillus thuringiensis serovar mexicanensis]|nr:hypothetical protein Btm27_05234 [Bacillus thuringiensis serovar mexicanensis]